MRWRQQWEVDGALKDWTPPEVLTLFHPSGTSGFDKDGAPGEYTYSISYFDWILVKATL